MRRLAVALRGFLVGMMLGGGFMLMGCGSTGMSAEDKAKHEAVMKSHPR